MMHCLDNAGIIISKTLVTVVVVVVVVVTAIDAALA